MIGSVVKEPEVVEIRTNSPGVDVPRSGLAQDLESVKAVPAGVSANCDIVLLGVGVTVKTPCFVVAPPNVATRLATKRSKSSVATLTWAVSYCGATAMLGVAGATRGAGAESPRSRDWLKAPPLARTATATTASHLAVRKGFPPLQLEID
jgi:hypothetical protein